MTSTWRWRGWESAVRIAALGLVGAGAVASFSAGRAAAQAMSSGSQPSCTMTTVPVANMTYYRCGPNWFQKAYTGGEVSFVMVAPPPGY